MFNGGMCGSEAFSMACDIRYLFRGDGELAGFNVHVNRSYRPYRTSSRERQGDRHTPVETLGYHQPWITTAKQVADLVRYEAPYQPPGSLCGVVDDCGNLPATLRAYRFRPEARRAAGF